MFCTSLPLDTASSWYGNKILNLNKCFSNNNSYKISNGFVVNNLGFMSFLNRNVEHIHEALKTCDYTDINCIRHNSNDLLSALNKLNFNNTLTNGLLEYFYKHKKPVIVRSSSILEDAALCSYAGVFDSFADIYTEESFLDAVKKVYLSAFSQRALIYYGGYIFPKMNVLVQEMVYPQVSGLCFTQHPDKSDCGYISLVEGPLAPLVGGQVNPEETWTFNEKNKWAIDLVHTDKTDKNRELRIMEVSKVFSIAKSLEVLFDHPVDVEWGIQNKQIYLFQVRPITQKPVEYVRKVEAFNPEGKIPLLEGVAVPPRQIPDTVVGKVSIQTDPNSTSFQEGDILVTNDTAPEWELLMHKANGLITNHGCRSSHAAIVAREIGLPAILGTVKATENLKDGQEVILHFNYPEWGAIYE